MRPVRLIMNAFGPYRGRVDLDFTSFDASSIYLISGPTGSGKTTIFDGISYALYNNASGGLRDVDMLKSQFATDDDLCFVDFTFDLGNVTYRIKRSPKQRAPGARGNPINHQAEVELFKEGVSIEQGTMNVDKVVESLLGISYDQFNQIVLLPQGEFRKLLLSSSLEKEEIFRNIFGTEGIQRFQTRLREQAQELNQAYKEYGMRLNQSISGMATEADEELKRAVVHEDYDEILVRLKALIDEGNTQLNALKKEITQLTVIEKNNETLLDLLGKEKAFEKKKKELEAESTLIQELEKALERHEQASAVQMEEDKLDALNKKGSDLEKQQTRSKDELLEVKEALEEWLKKQADSKMDESKLDQIREEVTALKQQASKFKDVENKETKVLTLNKSANGKGAEAKDLSKAEEQLTERLLDVQKNLSNVPVWREELEKIRKQLEEMKDAIEVNEKEKGILEKILQLQKTLSDQLEENKEVQKEYQDAERIYEEARHQYFGNLAGVLASELTEEEPCPVCGSMHHPTPANTDTEGMTQEKLAEFETAKDEQKITHTKLSEKMNHTADAIEEEKLALTGSYKEEFSKGLADVTEKVETLKAERADLEKEIEAVESSLKKEVSWQKEEDDLQEEQLQNRLKIQRLENEQETQVNEIKELEEEIKTIQKEFTHETADAVQKEIEQKTQRIKAIQDEAEAIRTALDKEQNNRTRLETSIRMLTAQIKENTAESAEQAEAFHALFKKYSLNEEYKEFILADVEREKHKGQISTYKEELTYNKRQLKQTKEDLKAYEENRSIEDIQVELEETVASRNKIIEEQEQLIRETGIYEKTYREIKENVERSKEILEPLKVYKELSEIANGSTNQTNKVSFERYVLSIYFMEILVAANHRFEKMTNGRFELVRKEEKAKHGAAAGLELNVFDRHSGKERNVKSLSGGETFKASLALALGLSDVIQSQQGGVRVDTLFIDEGFGTLDSESLEMAIETLMELQSTGRLIGIISHVNALKDRIPAKIIVENKQEGSHARIEVE